MLAPSYFISHEVAERFSCLRTAIKNSNKVFFVYRREDGTTSRRKVWPLGLFFWGKVWTLTAWCELRKTFRNFRIDRMNALEILGTVYRQQQGKTLEDYLETVCDGGATDLLSPNNRH